MVRNLEKFVTNKEGSTDSKKVPGYSSGDMFISHNKYIIYIYIFAIQKVYEGMKRAKINIFYLPSKD